MPPPLRGRSEERGSNFPGDHRSSSLGRTTHNKARPSAGMSLPTKKLPPGRARAASSGRDTTAAGARTARAVVASSSKRPAPRSLAGQPRASPYGQAATSRSGSQERIKPDPRASPVSRSSPPKRPGGVGSLPPRRKSTAPKKVSIIPLEVAYMDGQNGMQSLEIMAAPGATLSTLCTDVRRVLNRSGARTITLTSP